METANRQGNAGSSEHILVCLSASPSNARIIRTAAKMSAAFGGSFTALYVQTPGSANMDGESRDRLQSNMRLAEESGAGISTVYGEDVPFQISEFARVSGVTKVVIGRSRAGSRRFFGKPTIVEKLAEYSPVLEIHIIPDGASELKSMKIPRSYFREAVPRPLDLLITLLILVGATLIGLAFSAFSFTEANIISVYILGVLLTALFTRGFVCGLLDSVLSVVLFNFFFTEPRLNFHAYDPGYVATFVIMLVVSVIIGTLASKLKDHAKMSAQAAFKAKVLFDTNQL
ncbi:MAG: DUF4118 domain-containing protein, partial [Clostridia bacterium]|nr:DUF4118 domain-containing protein [Clostridia bacterium]